MCRMVYINIYWDEIKHIINTINDIFKFDTETEIFNDNIENYVKATKVFSIYWVIQGTLTAVITIVSPMFSKNLYLHVRFQDIKGNLHFCYNCRELPIPSFYPFDWNISPIYEIIYITQSISMLYLCGCLTTFDGLYGSISCLLAGQLYLLGVKFKNINYTCLVKIGVQKEDVIKFSKDFNTNESIATRKYVV